MYLWTSYMMSYIKHLTHKEIKIILDFVIKEKPGQESCELQEASKSVFNNLQPTKKFYYIKDLEVKKEKREDTKDWYTYLVWEYELPEKYIKLFEKLWIEIIYLYKVNHMYAVWTDYIITTVIV